MLPTRHEALHFAALPLHSTARDAAAGIPSRSFGVDTQPAGVESVGLGVALLYETVTRRDLRREGLASCVVLRLPTFGRGVGVPLGI